MIIFPFIYCPNFLHCIYVLSNGKIYSSMVWKRNKSVTLVNRVLASMPDGSKLRGWLMDLSLSPPFSSMEKLVTRGNHLTLQASILPWKGTNSSQRWLHPLSPSALWAAPSQSPSWNTCLSLLVRSWDLPRFCPLLFLSVPMSGVSPPRHPQLTHSVLYSVQASRASDLDFQRLTWLSTPSIFKTQLLIFPQQAWGISKFSISWQNQHPLAWPTWGHLDSTWSQHHHLWDGHIISAPLLASQLLNCPQREPF